MARPQIPSLLYQDVPGPDPKWCLRLIQQDSYAAPICALHYRGRFATMVVTMAENTSIFC